MELVLHAYVAVSGKQVKDAQLAVNPSPLQRTSLCHWHKVFTKINSFNRAEQDPRSKNVSASQTHLHLATPNREIASIYAI